MEEEEEEEKEEDKKGKSEMRRTKGGDIIELNHKRKIDKRL